MDAALPPAAACKFVAPAPHPILRSDRSVLNSAGLAVAITCLGTPLTLANLVRKDFMARNDHVQRHLQRRDIKCATEADWRDNIVKRAIGSQLIDEPQALLGKGKRQISVSRDACQRRSRVTSGAVGGEEKRQNLLLTLFELGGQFCRQNVLGSIAAQTIALGPKLDV